LIRFLLQSRTKKRRDYSGKLTVLYRLSSISRVNQFMIPA